MNQKLKSIGSAMALGLAMAVPAVSMAGGVLTTSTGLSMGVFDHGGLGFSGVGLSRPGTGDAITPGCLCEGWGVASGGVGNYSYGGGSSGLSGASFVAGATPDQGVSMVTTSAGLTVKHTYSQTASGNLFKVVVSIANATGAAVSDLRYARTLDWDVPPGHFSEDFTTIWTGAAGGAPVGNVLHTSFNPFAAPDPMVLRGVFGGPVNANATDQTGDLGAYFILSFGALADGATREFTTFIGAARDTASLLADFAANGVGAYSYSFDNDGPATFGWGFGGAGIGVPPIGGTPVPAPATLALLGAGLMGLASLRRRQAA